MLNKRFLLLLIFTFSLLFTASSLQAQEIDTITVGSVQVDPSPTEDVYFGVPVYMVNPEQINGTSLGLYYSSSDIIADSISIAGSIATNIANSSSSSTG